jgi:hypothetical protein
LFGDAGVGKTALIRSFLAALDPQEFFVIQVSATSGEFAGPPSFDALLEVICRRLDAAPPTGQRPATLAVLAAAVEALAHAGRTVLLAIDHADHLTNDVIAQATKLREYLDAAASSFVCIFIGSPTLASRLDVALRRPGVAQRVPEIRVSHPSGDELAALLAYEDSAQPGGPSLTPGAIDRISAYAKSNLNWAAPLADAARTLAANQGEREVTPELVRGALFELWSPEQAQPSDTLTRGTATPLNSATNPDSATTMQTGRSDIPLGSLSGADAGAKPSSPSAANPVSSVGLPPVSPAGPMMSDRSVSRRVSIQRPGALWIAVAAPVLLIFIGMVAIAVTDLADHFGQSHPGSVPELRSPVQQSSPEPSEGEIQPKDTAEQQNQIPQVPTELAPSGGVKPEAERAQPTNSEGDQRTVPMPAVSDIAPAPPTFDAPRPTAKAPKPKPPTPRASRKNQREGPADQWTQTR